MFRIVLVIIALAAGAGAAWLAFAMRQAPAPIAETAPPAPMQDVLVAAAALARGQVLAKEGMRWQSWPEGAVNSAYITRAAWPNALNTLVGSTVRSRLASGEPIRDEMLIPPNTGFLSATLPAGKRAVAVKISAENTAGGFILPNDRVDVISTGVREAVARDGQVEGDKRQVSRTILRNIPVLAIDQNVDEKSKDEKSSKDDKSKVKTAFVGKTATLEVDPLQAEILAAGEAMGGLSLALRSAADNGEIPPVDSPQPSSAAQLTPAPRSTPPLPTPPPGAEIDVYHGPRTEVRCFDDLGRRATDCAVSAPVPPGPVPVGPVSTIPVPTPGTPGVAGSFTAGPR